MIYIKANTHTNPPITIKICFPKIQHNKKIIEATKIKALLHKSIIASRSLRENRLFLLIRLTYPFKVFVIAISSRLTTFAFNVALFTIYHIFCHISFSNKYPFVTFTFLHINQLPLIYIIIILFISRFILKIRRFSTSYLCVF